MSSNTFCLKLNLLQCFMCFLLLWPAIYSFPTTDLAFNNRYERDTSETVFSQGEELDLVLQPGDEFLQFKMCCNKDGGCNEGIFQFCFQTTSQTQNPTGLSGCGARTCSFKVTYQPNGTRDFFIGWFKTSDSCFKGKIDDENIYAIYSTAGVLKTKTSPGCPLDRQPGNRLMLYVKEIPDGVIVTATNAQKYVEPTTLPPTTTPPPTEEPEEETTKKEPSAAEATTPETGMSDALKFSLIGVGIFVFLLIVGGIGFAIYWFCFKKKKSSKPAPPVIVPKTAADASPAAKEALIISNKTFEPKPKTTTKNETQDIEPSKQAASNVPSKNAAPRTFSPSNLVSPSAAAAEIPPPPTMVSKDYTASKEPNNNSEFSKTDASKLNKTDDQTQFDNDESGRDGKSMSKKSRKQTSFSKEVAAALDKTKIKKKKAIE